MVLKIVVLNLLHRKPRPHIGGVLYCNLLGNLLAYQQLLKVQPRRVQLDIGLFADRRYFGDSGLLIFKIQH